MNGKSFFTVFVSVLLSGLIAYATVKATTPEQASATTTSTAYNSAGQVVKTVNLSLSDYPDFTYAAEHAVDAVVYVKVTATQQYQVFDPFAEFFPFFGGGQGRQPQTKERVLEGSGSGVIIRSDGYIVTNNHVIANASDIEVTLNDNKTYKATLVGADPATDVALVKVDATDLPTIDFADSDRLRLGEWVLAIGSPLGEELRSTITAGIVSAKGRSMPSGGEFKIESFIQTDAAGNPGNSGGALVNKEGLLVGINTAIVSQTGSYTGYSFAVPSNIVRKIVSDLIDFGSVKRVMLGIRGGNVSDLRKDKDLKEKLEKLSLPAPEGVYVSEVTAGGTAQKAGVKVDDVIVGIDSVKISSMAELQAKVNSFHPGDKAVVKVIRDSRIVELPATFEAASETSETVSEDGTVMFYGATLKTVEKGVQVVSAGNGKMASAGAENGFIIQYVCDQKVKTAKDVLDIAKKAKRSIFIEGVTASGRPGYFGFGKDE